MPFNNNASFEWNINQLGTDLAKELGTVVTTTGISYTTLASDEVILVSGAIAPIFINLLASGIPVGKLYTVKDVGTATAGTGGIVISGLTASIDGIASGMAMTSGFNLKPSPAAGKTYNKVSFVYDGQNFWTI